MHMTDLFWDCVCVTPQHLSVDYTHVHVSEVTSNHAMVHPAGALDDAHVLKRGQNHRA